MSAVTDTLPPVATDASPRIRQSEELAAVTKAAEAVRSAELELRATIDERDRLIREAIDLYLVSHRQVARAAGLSLGRVHGILAND